MHTKLTLRLNRELIQQAKAFAKIRGKSVSQIVADYFTLLVERKKEDDIKITPIIKSLKGALRGADIDIDDYYNYLGEKYL